MPARAGKISDMLAHIQSAAVWADANNSREITMKKSKPKGGKKGGGY